MNVVTVGCFDLLHEGHANLLRAMRKKGKVVVLVHDDASIWALKGRMPVQSIDHREHNLRLSGLVSEVLRVCSVDPADYLYDLFLNGDWLFMRGDDMPDFPGRTAVERSSVTIELIPYTENVSSSDRRDACPT